MSAPNLSTRTDFNGRALDSSGDTEQHRILAVAGIWRPEHE
jgi:hypothetical protein